MEDVLAVYTQPNDPHYPQVCMEEKSTQLSGEVQVLLPTAPDKPRRDDTVRDHHPARAG